MQKFLKEMLNIYKKKKKHRIISFLSLHSHHHVPLGALCEYLNQFELI